MNEIAHETFDNVTEPVPVAVTVRYRNPPRSEKLGCVQNPRGSGEAMASAPSYSVLGSGSFESSEREEGAKVGGEFDGC